MTRMNDFLLNVVAMKCNPELILKQNKKIYMKKGFIMLIIQLCEYDNQADLLECQLLFFSSFFLS